jgi:hypothetical protein
MPSFAVRVQLMGDPTEKEYEILHALMAQYGLVRTVTGVDGKGNPTTSNLPHGTYYGTSSYEAGALRDVLRVAIKAQVQPKISVFVVDAKTWAFGE